MTDVLVTRDGKVLELIAQGSPLLQSERYHAPKREAFLGSFVEAVNALRKFCVIYFSHSTITCCLNQEHSLPAA